MTHRRAILAVAIAAVLVAAVALWFVRSSPSFVKQMQPVSSPLPAPTVTHALTDKISGEYPQLSLKTMTRDEATKISVARLMKDQFADHKVPINFYGKVLDQNMRPVAGARIHLQWSTIEAAEGTAFGEAFSDKRGLFALTGRHGKVLLVRVEKDGYYTGDRGSAFVPFEFAYPSSPDYYELDASNPVIFHLRKKGQGAKLIDKAVELSLPGNKTARMDLMAGHCTPEGTLQIQPNKPDRQAMIGRYAWLVKLSMADGGLIGNNDKFPFLAPENGYVPAVVLDMTDTSGPTWRNSLTKSYYFHLSSTNTYGRMTVDTLGGTSHVYLDYSYNPTPGNRNLEPAAK